MLGDCFRCGHSLSSHGENGCTAVASEVTGFGLEASDAALGSSTTWCDCTVRPPATETREPREYHAPIPRLPRGTPLPKQLAEQYPVGSPARMVLTELNTLLNVLGMTPGLPSKIAATVDDQAHHDGWLTVLDRNDRGTVLCVRQMLEHHQKRELLPFHSPQPIDPGRPYAAEWALRLRPVPPSAAALIADEDWQTGETLTDPNTHAPVVRRPDGTLRAALPRRLPAGDPLAELIFDQIVWVRTASGTLYPAPDQQHRPAPWTNQLSSWPTRLAGMITLLTGDIAAPCRAADRVHDVPPGVRELAARDWPDGTVLTRSDLTL